MQYLSLMRIVHLPARTPYAWKLQAPDFHIINSTIIDGVNVPADVTADWLLQHRPLNWFDVLHLHHIEFEDAEKLEHLLDACASAGVRTVHTAHDTRAIFGSNSKFQQKMKTLGLAGVDWVFLTRGSAAEVRKIIERDVQSTVIPHGYVADPTVLTGKQRKKEIGRLRSLLFGSVRPNRDHLSTLVNWSLASTSPQDQLHLLMRGLSPAHFQTPSQVPQTLDAIRADPRIVTTMRSYPTDAEIINAGVGADMLFLPYLWGSHSGQMELAFDLGLLPVCSSVGYLSEQFERHRGLVVEPEWFDWSSGNPYLFGERFVSALERARGRIISTGGEINEQFLEYRRAEHQEILDSYLRVYAGFA